MSVSNKSLITIPEKQIKRFDKLFEKYKKCTGFKLASCKHTNIIRDICHHYINSGLLFKGCV